MSLAQSDNEMTKQRRTSEIAAVHLLQKSAESQDTLVVAVADEHTRVIVHFDDFELVV